MKSNKKAILGMLAAMIMSLGLMNGINSQANDSNLQQWSYIAYEVGNTATETTGGKAVAYTASSAFGGAAGTMIIGGLASSNPIGWAIAAWGVVVGC
jgi:hypothetical protein